MKIILTVTGPDHPGIIAAVTTALTELDVNIENVSQTLMDEYFTMILQGRFDDGARSIEDIQAAMREAGARARVEVRVQSSAIFDAMHTL